VILTPTTTNGYSHIDQSPLCFRKSSWKDFEKFLAKKRKISNDIKPPPLKSIDGSSLAHFIPLLRYQAMKLFFRKFSIPRSPKGILVFNNKTII